MTTRTQIKHGSAQWWVLQTLRDFGSMSKELLISMGTHETKDALAAVRRLMLVTSNYAGDMELQPKGRNALMAANKARPRQTQPSVATSRTTVNAGVREIYTAPELKPYAGRPGAMDAYSMPSLVQGKRVFRSAA